MVRRKSLKINDTSEIRGGGEERKQTLEVLKTLEKWTVTFYINMIMIFEENLGKSISFPFQLFQLIFKNMQCVITTVTKKF